MIYALVYAKVTDHKKNGLIMQGPTIFDIKDTNAEADELAKNLMSKAKNCMVICKVYAMNTIFELETTLNDSKTYFKNIHTNMLEAKDILSSNRKR